MQLPQRPDTHLTYCLNVHPGETWPENLAAIENEVLAVRKIVAPNVPFGLGLRLSRKAAEALMDPDTRATFKDVLLKHNLYAFTINGFPFGTFHGARVKEDVYLPDWRSPERAEYTLMLADILADLLPEGIPGSISTVPAAYRAAIAHDAERATIASNLAEIAVELERISQEYGRQIDLALEPEPDCLIETTAEMIDFMESDMTATLPSLCRKYGLTRDAAETLIRRRIGYCLDTCHAAMQYETPADAIRQALSAGIHIPKIQISAALTASEPPVTTQQLAAFDDKVYLHQVRIRETDGTISRFPDLPQALAAKPPAHATNREWRIHCHVPLDFTGEGSALGSTAPLLTPDFFSLALQSGIAHLEIETYTFNVLPEALRAQGIIQGIANEINWTRNMLPPS